LPDATIRHDARLLSHIQARRVTLRHYAIRHSDYQDASSSSCLLRRHFSEATAATLLLYALLFISMLITITLTVHVAFDTPPATAFTSRFSAMPSHYVEYAFRHFAAFMPLVITPADYYYGITMMDTV